MLLVTMAASHEGIPFPAMVEMLLLQSIFEILRESGVRLPRAIGQAVSIVGALVIGESAVRAGIISAPAVIVVAITGITSFIVTPLYEFVFIARYFMIILGGSLGLFGITAGILAICAYLSSITSFGVPFLAPFAPFVWKDMKDSIFRVPLWAKKTRPLAFDSPNKKKQGAVI